MESFLNFWEKYLRPIWLNMIGLLGTEVLLLIILVGIFKIQGDILFVPIILIFILWLAQRKLPTFSPEIEIGILFAFPLELDFTREQMKKLYRTVNFNLRQRKLDPLLSVKVVPPNHLPHNQDEAHRIREKANARLIVWGNIEEGYHLGEKSIYIIPISFSYKIGLQKEKAEIVNRNFSAIVNEKEWKIQEKDDIKNRIFISKSIEDISLYIIGLVFHFAKHFQESVNILKDLITEYQKRNNLSKNEREAILIMKIVMSKNFGSIVRKHDFSPKDKDDKKKIEKGRQLIKEIRELDPDMPGAYALEAILNFITERNALVALELVYKQEKQRLYKDASVSYSKAFLNFYIGKLDYGWTHLQAATDPEREIDNPVNIIRFYEEILCQEPDKKQLHFPLGYLYLKDLKEQKLAKEEFLKFIEAYKDSDDKTVKELLGSSKIFLDNINER